MTMGTKQSLTKMAYRGLLTSTALGVAFAATGTLAQGLGGAFVTSVQTNAPQQENGEDNSIVITAPSVPSSLVVTSRPETPPAGASDSTSTATERPSPPTSLVISVMPAQPAPGSSDNASVATERGAAPLRS